MYKSRPSNSSGEYGFTLAMVGILDLTIIVGTIWITPQLK
jgi:hypothetical protein